MITFGFTIGTTADSDTHKASAVIFSVVVVGVTLAYRRLRTTVAELLIRLEELSSRDPLTAHSRARRSSARCTPGSATG